MSRGRRAASGSRGRHQQATGPETENRLPPGEAAGEYEDVIDEGIEFELRDGKHYHSTAVLHKLKPKSDSASTRFVLFIAIVATALVAIVATANRFGFGLAFNNNDANAVAAEDLLLIRQQLGGEDGENVLALVSSARAAADSRAKDALQQLLKEHDESFLQSQRHFESVTGSLQDASIRAETAANQAEAAVLSGLEQIRKTFQDETVPKLISEQAKVNEQSRLKMEKMAAGLEEASAKTDKAVLSAIEQIRKTFQDETVPKLISEQTKVNEQSRLKMEKMAAGLEEASDKTDKVVHAGLHKVLSKLHEVSEAMTAASGAGSAGSGSAGSGGGSAWGMALNATVLAVCVATLLLSYRTGSRAEVQRAQEFSKQLADVSYAVRQIADDLKRTADAQTTQIAASTPSPSEAAAAAAASPGLDAAALLTEKTELQKQVTALQGTHLTHFDNCLHVFQELLQGMQDGVGEMRAAGNGNAGNVSSVAAGLHEIVIASQECAQELKGDLSAHLLSTAAQLNLLKLQTEKLEMLLRQQEERQEHERGQEQEQVQVQVQGQGQRGSFVQQQAATGGDQGWQAALAKVAQQLAVLSDTVTTHLDHADQHHKHQSELAQLQHKHDKDLSLAQHKHEALSDKIDDLHVQHESRAEQVTSLQKHVERHYRELEQQQKLVDTLVKDNAELTEMLKKERDGSAKVLADALARAIDEMKGIALERDRLLAQKNLRSSVYATPGGAPNAER